jgi:hypothetical protein
MLTNENSCIEADSAYSTFSAHLSPDIKELQSFLIKRQH